MIPIRLVFVSLWCLSIYSQNYNMSNLNVIDAVLGMYVEDKICEIMNYFPVVEL